MEMAPVSDPVAGLTQVSEQLDEMIESAVLVPGSLTDARALIEVSEAVASKLAALQVRILDGIQESGVWAHDGHLNGQTFVAHVARLKPGTARSRGRLSRALGLLPVVRERVEAGEIGVDAAGRVASALSNPRARDALVACDGLIAEQAATLRYDTFDGWLKDLLVAADPDGARDRNERTHAKRNVSLTQEFDGSWRLHGGFGALQGAEIAEIWKRFCDAEFDADLDTARVEHGDEFTLDQLDRTDAQRRADAWDAMARAAAAAGVGADGSKIVTNIVIDHATFERELARLMGRPVDERIPGTDDSYQCRTLDGARLEPTEAVTHGLTGYIRRVVIGADSVVIDAGRERRLFTGTARIAAGIAHTHCAWPGCHRPISHCEIDHATEWHTCGPTDQHNAIPLCGRHNRHKHKHRTRARHQPDGTWTFHHPNDGPIT